MLDKILGSSYDFFGPELDDDELNCPIKFEPSQDHLITNCNEGIGRVQVINQVAQKIAESKIRPTWLRHNGSIELSELRKVVEMTDEVAHKLLTEKGYMKISDLHIFDREALCKASESAQNKYRCNPCPVENNEGLYNIEEVIFSPAIAMRIQMGSNFDVRNCRDIFKALPKPIELDRYEVLDVLKPINTLGKVKDTADRQFWENLVTLTIFGMITLGALYYLYSRGLLNSLIDYIKMNPLKISH